MNPAAEVPAQELETDHPDSGGTLDKRRVVANVHLTKATPFSSWQKQSGIICVCCHESSHSLHKVSGFFAMTDTKRPIRVANASGATGDGPLALHRLVREGPVDVVTADYLAEVNIGAPHASPWPRRDCRS